MIFMNFLSLFIEYSRVLGWRTSKVICFSYLSNRWSPHCDYMYRIPYNICQKAYRILVIFLALMTTHCLHNAILTFQATCLSPVHDFHHLLYIVMVIIFNKLYAVPLHQIDSKHTVISHMKKSPSSHTSAELHPIFRPCIIFSGCIM